MQDKNIELLSKKIDENQKKEKKINNFVELLDGLTSTEDKKKTLWKEIYENALEDREKAKILFNDCYQIMSGTDIADHISVGQIMSKYLERMSKSNDQILKLAELIAKEETENSEELSEDELFLKIQGGR
jgi:hypothetical protein